MGRVPEQNYTLFEFFTNSLQYKNANIANFILAVPLQIDCAGSPPSLAGVGWGWWLQLEGWWPQLGGDDLSRGGGGVRCLLLSPIRPGTSPHQILSILCICEKLDFLGYQFDILMTHFGILGPSIQCRTSNRYSLRTFYGQRCLVPSGCLCHPFL